MHSVRLHPGGVLAIEEIERPRPGAGEVLVGVCAAALTRDELEWPTDRLPAVPSYEISGTIAELGPEVADVAVGDEVYALLDFGRDGGPVYSWASRPNFDVSRPQVGSIRRHH